MGSCEHLASIARPARSDVQRELRVDAQEKQHLAQQAEANEAKCVCRPSG
jgi:hypothetical protein